MRKDAYSNVAALQAIVPAVKTAAGEGITIDRQGFDALLFVINTGAVAGDGDFEIAMQESGDGSNFELAVAADVLGTTPGTLAENSAYRLSYIGKKRYVRLALTKEGGTSIALGAVAVLGLPAMAPVT